MSFSDRFRTTKTIFGRIHTRVSDGLIPYIRTDSIFPSERGSRERKVIKVGGPHRLRDEQLNDGMCQLRLEELSLAERRVFALIHGYSVKS